MWVRIKDYLDNRGVTVSSKGRPTIFFVYLLFAFILLLTPPYYTELILKNSFIRISKKDNYTSLFFFYDSLHVNITVLTN